MAEIDEEQDRIEWLGRVCTGLHAKYADLTEGTPASYIPELANVDPDCFAIAAVAIGGNEKLVGDHDQHFTIQSISKLMLYGLALETHGRSAVLERVGVAPTGDPFNAIELDEHSHRAPNPMVNAGAIAITDMVEGADLEDRVATVSSLFERYLGRRPEVDSAVYASERATGHRNRAIAYLLLDRGIIDDRVDETLDLYFMQSSVLVTARDLAVIGATIANNGVHPREDEHPDQQVPTNVQTRHGGVLVDERRRLEHVVGGRQFGDGVDEPRRHQARWCNGERHEDHEPDSARDEHRIPQ